MRKLYIINKDFTKLLYAQFISSLGDMIVLITLPFIILSIDSSPNTLAVVLGIEAFFYAIFLLIGGVIADRVDKKRLMLLSDITRFTTQAVLAILIYLGIIQVVYFVILISIYSIAGAFFRPAATGALPQIISSNDIKKANALLHSANNIASLIGPLLAGILISQFSSGIIYVLDAITFLISFLFIFCTFIPFRQPSKAAQSLHIFQDFKLGWFEMIRNKWIFIGILSRAVYHFFVLPALYVLGPLIAKESLDGASSWALIVISMGVGGMIGSLLAIKKTVKSPMLLCILLLSIASLQPLIFVISNNIIFILVCFFLLSLIVYLQYILWISLIQKQIPQNFISKIYSWDQLGYAVILPVGMLVIIPFTELLSVNITLILYAIIPTIFCGSMLLFKDIRNFKV